MNILPTMGKGYKTTSPTQKGKQPQMVSHPPIMPPTAPIAEPPD